MVAAGQLLILLLAGGASLFMAWTIGAGSSGSTPFVPAVGAGAVAVMRAGFFVGILGFAGAVLQGANVTDAVGTGLIGGVSLTAPAATLLLVLAASLVTIGIFTGYPIATAFTVTGAVIGVGLGLGGGPSGRPISRSVRYGCSFPLSGTVLHTSPRVCFEATASPNATASRYSAGSSASSSRISPLRCSGPILVVHRSPPSLQQAFRYRHSPVEALSHWPSLSFLRSSSTGISMSDVEAAQQRFLVALGGLVAFSAGGSQVGLAVGPLLAAVTDTSLSVAVPLLALLAFGGIGLLAGSWMGAPRMIKAIAQDYSSLGPRRSIAALIPSFAIAQTAVLFGIPVSFNEIIVSAVVGSGFTAGSAGMSTHKMLYTVVAWVGSLALAVGVGYGAMWALGRVL